MTPPLKHREQQILSMLAEGLSAPAIAKKLSLAADTVRWYIKQLYRELGVSSRAEAIRMAMTRGYLSEAVPRAPTPPPSRSAIRYATNDGVHIAYQTVGDGPIDVLFVHGFLSHLDLAWEDPEFSAFFEQLGRVARVILFDKRGVGVSDRTVGPSTLEQTVADARAVLAAAGSTRAVIVGTSEGGAAAILLASMQPERVDRLVLINASPFIGGHGVEFPWPSANDRHRVRGNPEPQDWGDAWGLERFAPSRAGRENFRVWWSKLLRAAASPSSISTVLENSRAVDIRALLPSVSTPTLVLHRIGDRLVPPAAGRYLAARLPNAKLVELAGDDHVYFVDSDALVRTLTAYLQEPTQSSAPHMFIAVLLCLRTPSPHHDRALQECFETHHARFVRQSGDVRWACFEGASAAIRCARMLRRLPILRNSGIALHVGSCAVTDGTPNGDTLRRVIETADVATADVVTSGHILVTGTLRDILAGTDVKLSVHSVAPSTGDLPASTTWALHDETLSPHD